MKMIRFQNGLQIGLLALALQAGIVDAPGVAVADEPKASAAIRPDPEGQATRVLIGVFVVDISEIDDAKQTFKADLYVTLRWKDRRLESSDVRRIVQLAKVWHPAVQIVNQRHLERELPQDVVKVDRDGNVVYEQRLEGTFVVPLNLHRFPLDEQVLAFRIVGPGHSSTDVEFVPDEHSGRAQNFSIMDWMIGSPASQTD